jgi:hypothetical protein
VTPKNLGAKYQQPTFSAGKGRFEKENVTSFFVCIYIHIYIG